VTLCLDMQKGTENPDASARQKAERMEQFLMISSSMQAIEKTGDVHFNPDQWLRASSTMSSAASAFPESSSAAAASSAECPALADIAHGSLDKATDTERRPVASSPSTSSITGGCPYSAQVFKQKEAHPTKQFVFGVGPRTCLGQNLAIVELVSFLIVLARDVKEVQMSVEEQERKMGLFFPPPTGLPLRFIPRSN
jgi:hypothetical protein